MTNHAGYAIETEDGEQTMVYNFATARWYVKQGLAKRVYDTYSGRYIVVRVKA